MRQALLTNRQIGNLRERLREVHNQICHWLPRVERIAVVIYDSETDLLKTFIDSTGGDSGNPLPHYQIPLAEVPSLQRILAEGQPRIIDDLADQGQSSSTHTAALLEGGFLSSYTAPLFHGDDFFGFVFFNAREPGVFSGAATAHLELFSQLLSLIVADVFTTLHSVQFAVRSAETFMRARDRETSAHLKRMAHYCRLVAQQIAAQQELSDEFIEYLFRLSPLHDIGKIAVPDAVLLKAGRLTDEEKQVMRSHVQEGAHIVDSVLGELRPAGIDVTAIARNIVLRHHENFDGTGYPSGLAGEAIPMEGRIVAVADVFDALTSERPYKAAWSDEDAFAELTSQSGSKFDPDCVQALREAQNAIPDIQQRFASDPLG